MAFQMKQTLQLPYSNFKHAASILEGIAPIDYFLAIEVTRSCLLLGCDINKTDVASDGVDQSEVTNTNDVRSDRERTELLFHLVMLASQKLSEGHTCLPIDKAAHFKLGFNVDDDGIVTHQGYVFPGLDAIDQALIGFKVDEQLLVYREQKLYLKRYADFESELMGYITPKLSLKLAKEVTPHSYDVTNIARAIDLVFPEERVISPKEQLPVGTIQDNVKEKEKEKEIDWQKIAVANALNKDFSIIAGGPGTGKTYTVTKLLATLMLLEHQCGRSPIIKLTAPTGKAAQRLSESIIDAIKGFKQTFVGTPISPLLDKLPTSAETLHRMLGVIPNSPNFRHDQDSPLAVDILLIDEVSMVDLPMMTRVFRALPPHAKIILLGDADQLPSVAAGSVLADLAPRPHYGFSEENMSYLVDVTKDTSIKTFAANKKAPLDHVTILLKSRRFDGKGIIGRVAKEVIEGNNSNSWQILNENLPPNEPNQLTHANQVVINPTDTQWLKGFVKHYYQPLFSAIDVNQAFNLLAKFRILAATRQGEYGVEALNEKVKQHLVDLRLVNPLNDIYHGLPIMITQNDYRIGLYNGDVGLIWRHENGQLMAAFESENNEVRWVIPSRLPTFESVYAMTIHKTQGSEFDHVAMVLPAQTDNKLLSRELLYTGITRAKSRLNIICRENVWYGAVAAKVERHSGLTLSS